MAVTSCNISSRQIVADGRDFGDVGPYEQLDGTAYFAVDPDHARNGGITDLHLGPRDANGLVNFSADIRILKPVDTQRGNRRLLLDVPNRGRRPVLRLFNDATSSWAAPSGPMDLGSAFLLHKGYTVIWCGWQHDVPDLDGLVRAYFPEAHDRDDHPMTGKVMVNFQPNTPQQVQLLADRQHRPYPASDLYDPDAMLLVWDEDQDPFEIIPRDQWSFARLEDNQVVPDASHIYLTSGFVPGRRYQVIYTTTGAPIVGLGLLTTRDIAAFLRYGSASTGNPCAGNIEYAYAFGASQCGSYLRQLLYLGLNEDEEERLVFDGLLVHIGSSARGVSFNLRFGQPSSTVGPRLNDAFPFACTLQNDPETGRTDGLLARLEERNKLPKIFFIYSSSEYWGGASLTHTNVEGTGDADPPSSVRIYHFAGTQHVPSIGGTPTQPLTDGDGNVGFRGEYFFNCVAYRPLMKAALVRLDQWVCDEQSPPSSLYPRLSDGTAVSPTQTAETFETIPGVKLPAPLPQIHRLDFGIESGIATRLPPSVGQTYTYLVSAVDADGNERSGIRLPDISVPLATYMGWNRRHADMGAPGKIIRGTGAILPFAPTRRVREDTGDPRLSIEERYASKADYLNRVTQEAEQLAADGYVLEEDVPSLLERASERYDLLYSQNQST